ncbi:MAG: PhoH family protein [Bacteroidota bacterium]
MSEIVMTLDGVDLLALYGDNDANLNLLRKAFPETKITSRGETIKINGKKAESQRVKTKLELMIRILGEHKQLNRQDVLEILGGDNPYKNKIPKGANSGVIVYGRGGKAITARTKNQAKLVKSADENDIVFAIGPAGTGKTYTAVALAVRALKNRLVKKIILTRPAVEAGESLGFLPGDLKEKIDPYLRPLYDALDDMIPAEKLNHFTQTRVIEIAPLAYMRGRTLDNAFIILDEAQNTTMTQLKMFLTRIGPSAKCIITGDLTQIDLPRNQKSGLYRSLNSLKDINGIGAIFLDTDDVVRHRLVKHIIKAFDKMAQADKDSREANKILEAKKMQEALSKDHSD